MKRLYALAAVFALIAAMAPKPAPPIVLDRHYGHDPRLGHQDAYDGEFWLLTRSEGHEEWVRVSALQYQQAVIGQRMK